MYVQMRSKSVVLHVYLVFVDCVVVVFYLLIFYV